MEAALVYIGCSKAYELNVEHQERHLTEFNEIWDGRNNCDINIEQNN